MELNSVNENSNWQRACESSLECRYVLVSTLTEIRIVTVQKEPIHNKLIIQDGNLGSLEQGPVSVMVELEKNGRVFYGKLRGRVSELTFENTERVDDSEENFITRGLGVARSLIAGHRKRLYHVEHQKDNLILQALPSFITSSRQKDLKQLKID